MEGCYVSFNDGTNVDNELFRVYPDELRRQYQPESTETQRRLHQPADQADGRMGQFDGRLQQPALHDQPALSGI